jgi:hypothetical protein
MCLECWFGVYLLPQQSHITFEEKQLKPLCRVAHQTPYSVGPVHNRTL